MTFKQQKWINNFKTPYLFGSHIVFKLKYKGKFWHFY